MPKLNLLVVQRRRAAPSWLLNAALALAILAVGYGGLALSQQRTSVQSEIPKLQAQQLTIQQQISDRTKAINDLQTQIAAAKQQVDASKSSIQQLASSKIDWYEALVALSNAQVTGIQFTSISNPDPQVMEAAGTADNSNAVARFRSQIATAAPLLSLQGMTVEQGSVEGLIFTAQILIGQPQQ